MAKKKQINETIYTPHKNYPEGTVCFLCNKPIQSRIAYTSSNLNNYFYCPICVSNMWNKYVNDRMKSAQPFPLERVVYVGKMSHNCSSSTYKNKLFWFGDKKNKKYIEVYQCVCCNEYIMRRDDYNKYSSVIEEGYIVYDSKTNKPFPKLTRSPNYCSQIVAKASHSEVPSHIQWAIKHPYRGGSCSGK